MIDELRRKLNIIIFEHDSKLGKLFDIGLILSVLASVLVVMLETVEELNHKYANLFITLEWMFTLFFTIELTLRLFCVEKKLRYLFSFYGIVDVLSILPSYLAFFVPGAQGFLIFRSMRLIRIFRILKLNHYTRAGSALTKALFQSVPKISVFLVAVSTLVVIVGSMMYFVEGQENGFTSIPKSVYWAIVTLTTVGYGDITPQTVGGQILSSLLMIAGYGIIAVPTGIVSVEIARTAGQNLHENMNLCSHCRQVIEEEPLDESLK